MSYKVTVGNGLDSVEAILQTEGEVIKYLEVQAITFKQALKTLAQAVPVIVEAKVTSAGTQTTQVEAPQKPTPQGVVPEVCPKCGKKTYYTNTIKKEGANLGKKFKKCATCKHIDWMDCQKTGYSK